MLRAARIGVAPGQSREQSAGNPGAGESGAPRRGSPWILGPVPDLGLFIGTPLLILPVFFLSRRFWALDDIYAFVISFGALGHHLPGMMRAYGDQALFQRYRTRFVVAPLFLFSVSALFAFLEPSVTLLAAYLWGVWHGLMQTHGFVRIYDAKRGSFAAATAFLDQGMCLFWFGAAVLFSPSRVHLILELFYKSGGSPVPAGLIEDIRIVWAVLTVGVTLVFLGNLVRCLRRGAPPSPIKLLLLTTSIAFFWYTNVAVSNMLAGVMLFEAFHDVQYVTITWLYGRKQVEGSAGVGRFMRFLFRRSGVLLGLYVMLVLLYGSPPFVLRGVALTPVREILQSFVVASALLHFYYDGFIWKLRDQRTRDGLGIGGGRTDTARSWRLSSGSRHALKWAFFLLPIVYLGVARAQGTMSEEERLAALASVLPGSAEAQSQQGMVLFRHGDVEGAVSATRRAVRLEADNPMYRRNLEVSLLALAQHRLQEADEESARSILLEAQRTDDRVVDRLYAEGVDRQRSGDRPAALLLYESILLLAPDHPDAHLSIAFMMRRDGRWDQALRHALRAQAARPGDARLAALVSEARARLASPLPPSEAHPAAD